MKGYWFVGLVFGGLVTACGGGGGDSSAPPPEDEAPDEVEVARFDVRDVDQLRAYRPQSPYADVLQGCVLIEQTSDACTLDLLPFIAQGTPDFTREDILDRVLVTHDWMGQRFERLLEDAPEHMVTLFGSLISIAIGSTIRPSSYWSVTGGMQIDPVYLWLSVDEKANVSIEDDFRSDYGRDLQFWLFGSLRQGLESATGYHSLTDSQERTLPEIRLSFFRLLYHELAHAVDFLPSSSLATLDPELTPLTALQANSENWLSPRLYLDLPLYSDELRALAQVSYKGEQASEVQRAFTPSDVGSLMGGDGAVKYYGYTTIREDFATLFAMAMIKHEFDVDYYTAFVEKPADETSYGCDELLVGWGARNRVADPQVAPRARWVLESIYGSSDWIESLFTSRIGEYEPMQPGLDWCSNRDIAVKTADSFTQTRTHRQAGTDSRLQLEAERRDYEH